MLWRKTTHEVSSIECSTHLSSLFNPKYKTRLILLFQTSPIQLVAIDQTGVRVVFCIKTSRIS